MRNSWLTRFLGRTMGVVIIVVVVSVGVRLVLTMLGAILPGEVMALLGQGWDLLYQMLAPALASLTALGLLWLLYWSIFGGGNRS